MGEGCRAGFGEGRGGGGGSWWIFTSCVWRDCGKLPFFFSLCAFWALSALPLATRAPAALLICLALGMVASSIWLMPGYYIISQGKATSSPLRLCSICSAVSGWRSRRTGGAVDQADWRPPVSKGTAFIKPTKAPLDRWDGGAKSKRWTMSYMLTGYTATYMCTDKPEL